MTSRKATADGVLLAVASAWAGHLGEDSAVQDAG